MRLDDGRVIPNFVTQALTGEPLTGYGDGEQTRSFCYVSDMIGGLVTLLESDVKEPVNLGTPDERTINDLAEIIIDITGSNSDITHEELPPQDPQVRRPDITKARTELGWTPDVSLWEGLRQSIKYFEMQL
jgi:dTDP-glucose 4,6-dehydratase